MRFSSRLEQLRQKELKEGPKYEVSHRRLGPKTEIIVGDCREVIPALPKDLSPTLVFADPPFNIGQEYNEFRDDIPIQDYEQFTREWVSAASSLLTDKGVLCIHVPDHVVPMVLLSPPKQMEMSSWIIWHYRFGQHQTSRFINSKCHCLVYTKGNHRWNADSVMVESDRASKYADIRTNNTSHPGMRLPFDVWGIPSDGPYWGRVQGNSKERWCRNNGAPYDHPNQLPEVYLERLIRAYSGKGDLIMDPFCGSGTTGTVARALGRRSLSIDISALSAESAFQRMTVRGSVRVGK